MRLKKWQAFFEAKSIYFSESDEIKEVKDKLKLSDNQIKSYFYDVLDEGFYITINSTIFEKSYGADINYSVELSISILNPAKTSHSSPKLNDYSEFLETQSKLLKSIESCTERLCFAEEIKLANCHVTGVPFWGSGNNTREQSNLTVRIHLIQEIHTDEVEKARKKFESNDSPVKKFYDRLVKLLKSRGVAEAERLIDTQDIEEHGYIMFGFMTNDEIIVIADYHYDQPYNSDSSLIIHQHEMDRAVEYYQDGECSEYL